MCPHSDIVNFNLPQTQQDVDPVCVPIAILSTSTCLKPSKMLIQCAILSTSTCLKPSKMLIQCASPWSYQPASTQCDTDPMYTLECKRIESKCDGRIHPSMSINNTFRKEKKCPFSPLWMTHQQIRRPVLQNRKRIELRKGSIVER